MSLVRPVEIIGDDGGKYFTVATVWGKGTNMNGSTSLVAQRIRDQISQHVTAFAAQYYKENP